MIHCHDQPWQIIKSHIIIIMLFSEQDDNIPIAISLVMWFIAALNVLYAEALVNWKISKSLIQNWHGYYIYSELSSTSHDVINGIVFDVIK